MDVDAVCIQKLTPAEREQCFKQGLCLCCRKPGHNASSCTTFTSNSTSFKYTRKVAKVVEDLPTLEKIESDDDKKIVGKASFTLDF
jgi:hypothetical protein